MKITEVSQPTDQTLLESLQENNDTGVLAEDLTKVVRTHNNKQWSKAMTLEESLSVDRMIAEGRFPQ